LKYDPAKEEHKQFEVKQDPLKPKKSKGKKNKR